MLGALLSYQETYEKKPSSPSSTASTRVMLKGSAS
jgi:hypothetical protein